MAPPPQHHRARLAVRSDYAWPRCAFSTASAASAVCAQHRAANSTLTCQDGVRRQTPPSWPMAIRGWQAQRVTAATARLTLRACRDARDIGQRRQLETPTCIAASAHAPQRSRCGVRALHPRTPNVPRELHVRRHRLCHLCTSLACRPSSARTHAISVWSLLFVMDHRARSPIGAAQSHALDRRTRKLHRCDAQTRAGVIVADHVAHSRSSTKICGACVDGGWSRPTRGRIWTKSVLGGATDSPRNRLSPQQLGLFVG